MAAGYSQSSTRTLLIILSILIAFSLFNFRSSKACEMSTYWGYKSSEGSLEELCETGTVKYVNLAFLSQFWLRPDACSKLDWPLRSPPQAPAGLLSPGPTGPLGDAPLDGIDFASSSPSLYWDDLVRALGNLNSPHKKVYLSAAGSCSYPDPILGKAIDTGLFDYIWLKSYNNPQCDCDMGISCVLASWFKWSCSLPPGKQLLFFSLAPKQSCFLSQIFKTITYSPSYGGFLLPGGVYKVQDLKIIYEWLLAGMTVVKGTGAAGKCSLQLEVQTADAKEERPAIAAAEQAVDGPKTGCTCALSWQVMKMTGAASQTGCAVCQC
ncbi:Hevamine-A [Sesamum alatum]|uniref:chitinase n=1 Tax=Sesamum alatum TaxID=300844 RepID=A0AAE1YQ63_9LAMI|nr:Hevamine-A [Sesamum alatum]